MKKKIFFVLLLVFCKGISQTDSNNETILKWSKIYENKAIRFQNIPDYNPDSIRIYFEKATTLLQKKPSCFNGELANIYLQRSRFSKVDYSIYGLDSLSKIGWHYLNTENNQPKNNELKYEFLSNWAFIKLELGQNKTALSLFSKAIALSENFKNQDSVGKVVLDKGIFYERYSLAD